MTSSASSTLPALSKLNGWIRRGRIQLGLNRDRQQQLLYRHELATGYQKVFVVRVLRTEIHGQQEWVLVARDEQTARNAHDADWATLTKPRYGNRFGLAKDKVNLTELLGEDRPGTLQEPTKRVFWSPRRRRAARLDLHPWSRPHTWPRAEDQSEAI